MRSRSMPYIFFFSSRRRHTRCSRDWSSDVCSSDLGVHFFLDDIGELPGAALEKACILEYRGIDAFISVNSRYIGDGFLHEAPVWLLFREDIRRAPRRLVQMRAPYSLS